MSLFRTEAKRIGAHTYKVRQLNAVEGRRALFRLSKLVGPSLVSAEEKGTIGEALGSLVERLSEADFDHFYDLFARCTTVSGGTYREGAEPELSSDQMSLTHFADNYFEMVEWFAFCLEVNFASFFTQAKERLKKVQKTVAVSTAST